MFITKSLVAAAAFMLSGCILPEVVPVISFRGDTHFSPDERQCVEKGFKVWRDQTSGLADARVKWDYMSDDVPSVRKLWPEAKVLRWDSEMAVVHEKDNQLVAACIDDAAPGEEDGCFGVALLGEVSPHGGIHADITKKLSPVELRIVADRVVEEDGSIGDLCTQVVAHELGHVWGVGHISRNKQNVMFPSSNPSQGTCLKPDDLLGFCYVNDCGHVKMSPCPYNPEK